MSGPATDADLAEAVKAAARALNEAIDAADAAGLDVEIELQHESSTVGRKPVVFADIARPL